MSIYGTYLNEESTLLYEEYDYYDVLSEATAEQKEDTKNRIEIARALENAVSGFLSETGAAKIYDFVSYEQNRVFSKKPDKKFCKGKINYVKIICSRTNWGAQIGRAIGSITGLPALGDAIGGAAQKVADKLDGKEEEIRKAVEKINEDPDFTKLVTRCDKLIKNYGYHVSNVGCKGNDQITFTITIAKLAD